MKVTIIGIVIGIIVAAIMDVIIYKRVDSEKKVTAICALTPPVVCIVFALVWFLARYFVK